MHAVFRLQLVREDENRRELLDRQPLEVSPEAGVSDVVYDGECKKIRLWQEREVGGSVQVIAMNVHLVHCQQTAAPVL